MAVRRKIAPHPFYRMTLFLYPRTYRHEYGDQMVQTLQDMLDETDSSLARMSVWLRVAIEIPLSALKENVNAIGEGGMNKLTKISNKRLVIGGVAVLVLVAGIAIGMGRYSIAGGTASIFYERSLHNVAVAQNSALSHPLTALSGRTATFTDECAAVPTNNIKMEINCEASERMYTKLGQSTADKATMLQSVSEVAAALKEEGYQSGSNGVTLTNLVVGTYEGKDYTPDAFYEKFIGKVVCTFDTSIAYANPGQPAINISLGCSRLLDPFGKPYRSAPYYGDPNY